MKKLSEMTKEEREEFEKNFSKKLKELRQEARERVAFDKKAEKEDKPVKDH